ncbi:hypothetical protein [Rivihabitans pingtungensis]|uniref:Uncharacterized protein n=1 Tax=Rivihabitans pingtungensis TaxID=1054498 RepID=A0A318KJM3_9NEIS|nr:hypothetical protein [Rivihabitans pingtungensis]PXX75150.1 hypothetical protein DFR34_1273 [Rivihabitans pingtungensis]
MGSPLSPDERTDIAGLIKGFQISDVANVYFDAVNSILDEFKDLEEKLEEDAKDFRELMIDSAVCFLPFSPFLKVVMSGLGTSVVKKLGGMDFTRTAIADGAKELVKALMAEKIFTVEEKEEWAALEKVATEMKEGMRKRMFALYQFVDKYTDGKNHDVNANVKMLPDSVLIAIYYKYHVDNYSLLSVRRMICEQFKVVKYFLVAPWKGRAAVRKDSGLPEKLPSLSSPTRLLAEWSLYLFEFQPDAKHRYFLPVMKVSYFEVNPHRSEGDGRYKNTRNVFTVVPPFILIRAIRKGLSVGIVTVCSSSKMPVEDLVKCGILGGDKRIAKKYAYSLVRMRGFLVDSADKFEIVNMSLPSEVDWVSDY